MTTGRDYDMRSAAAAAAGGGGTQSEKPPVSAQLLLPVLIRPILLKIERRDPAAANKLRSAIHRAESQSPGIMFDLVVGLIKRASNAQSALLNHSPSISTNHGGDHSALSPVMRTGSPLSVNMVESLLRLQGVIPELEEFKCRRQEEIFQDLNRKSLMLKKILSRVPDEIQDRKTFLETIKEIASAIKKLLDVVNVILAAALDPGHPLAHIVGSQLLASSDKQLLKVQRQDFIRYSKRFSNTLKDFFRDGQPQPVFLAACQLIIQTNAIQVAIKSRCDPTR